jgi:hypothetical protein
MLLASAVVGRYVRDSVAGRDGDAAVARRWCKGGAKVGRCDAVARR